MKFFHTLEIMTKNISVKKAESLSSIEEKLSYLDSNFDYKLRVPASLNTRGALGVEVAIIQLIFTWVKSNSKGSIFHSFQSESDDFKELCKSIYGIALLSLSDSILDKSLQPISRRKALEDAIEPIKKLRESNFESAFPSQYFGIPCLKKPTYHREFDMPFYNRNTMSVIESGAFLTVFKKALKAAIPEKIGSSGLKQIDDVIGIRKISEIFWELFKNTHDHGMKDLEGNILETNFRGLILQRQHVTRKYLDSWCGEEPSKAQLNFQKHLLKQDRDKFPVLDLSVFDMGEGINELSEFKAGFDDPAKNLIWCLAKGNSRFSGPSRGSGFSNVIERIINNQGWLRIRSGNVVLEKSFDNNKACGITEDDVRVTDHTVVGTTISISIPLLTSYKNQVNT